jgi:hypothetical protein
MLPAWVITLFVRSVIPSGERWHPATTHCWDVSAACASGVS